jgi:hypothetical protein
MTKQAKVPALRFPEFHGEWGDEKLKYGEWRMKENNVNKDKSYKFAVRICQTFKIFTRQGYESYTYYQIKYY